MSQIHGQDLGGGGDDVVGLPTVEPIGGDGLFIIELPAAVGGFFGAEERGDGGQVGVAGGAEGGEEFVEEGGGAVEENGFGAVVEVAVVGFGLLVALVAVQSEVVAVEVPVAGGGHVAEEGAVEAVVVAVGEEVVVSGEGGVGFECLRFISWDALEYKKAQWK